MAVFAWVAGDPFNYEMDDDPFYDAVRDVSSDVFIAVADSRRYLQGKSFDFGVWNLNLSIDAVQRLQSDEFGWPEWAAVPVGTIGMIAGFSPLFVTTLMAYTNPWTAGPAFVLDAYNIYRYFD